MEITAQIHSEHLEIQKLLCDIQSCLNQGLERDALMIELIYRLFLHHQKEEKIFYRTFLQKLDDWQIILESYEEHNLIETMMEDFQLETLSMLPPTPPSRHPPAPTLGKLF